jgi:hypothetical protein
MLSGRLVELIAEHAQTIAGLVVEKIRKHPDLTVLAARPALDSTEWGVSILSVLARWLAHPNSEEFGKEGDRLGHADCEENVPLHESVLRLQMLKDQIIQFVHTHGFITDYLDLYTEEELEHRVTRFFDAMIYRVVCCYEDAQRRSARLAS